MSVDLNSQSGVPGDLPPSPQPGLQAYFIQNTSQCLGRVTVRARLRSRSCQSPQDDAGEVLNTRVDNTTVEQFRVERNFGFQLGLDVGPVSAPDRSIRWVVK
jgi:hypothetical protein